MDGGGRQKERAGWVKAQVKEHSSGRKEKKHLQSPGSWNHHHGESGKYKISAPPSTAGRASSPNASTTDGTPYDSEMDTSWILDQTTSMTDFTPASSLAAMSGGTPAALTGTSAQLSPANSPNEFEFEPGLVSLYLDYVFPFLNPFYAPRLIEGGRGWLLVVLMRNKALLHAALSLTSYVFSVALSQDDEAGVHDTCKQHAWESLPKQQELSMRELQADIQELDKRGVKGYMKESTQVMSSVVQQLLFETAVGNTGNWQIHLDAASVLFEQIMEHHGTDADGLPAWHLLLIQLQGSPTTPTPIPQKTPWRADQAALRFVTASLIFFDVLAATALEQAPRLQKYHQHILAAPEQNSAGHELIPPKLRLDMKDFVGIENWILLAIGSIAALDSWKKEMKASNSLSITQLVTRAGSIECNLRTKIPTLDLPPPPSPPPHAFDPAVRPDQPRPNAVSRIWAQAALTYLAIVVSGWQPRSPEIRVSVTLTLAMMRALPSPACLRTVVWPLCVTGCVAEREEEAGIRNMVASMDTAQAFGTTTEAMKIMEEVWANRERIGESPDSWDVAACLKSLGHPALLK